MSDSLSIICEEKRTVLGDLAAVGIEDLLKSFFSCKSEKTLLAYRQDIEDFMAFAKHEDIRRTAEFLLSRGHGQANSLVLGYKSDMRARGLAPATVNRRLAAIRSLVGLANTLGVVNWKIEIKNMPSEAYRETAGPGKGAVQKLIDKLGQQKGRKMVRDRAILRLLYDLALRRTEVANLDFEDLDIENNRIAVIGKGRIERKFLTLPKVTMEALKDWLQLRGLHKGPLFTNFDRAKKGQRLSATSIYRLVRSLGKSIGIRLRPHGLRHTAITEACKAAQAHGIGLEEVLDFSRHKDVKTLMVYRDRDRDVQGKLASLIANEISQ